MARIVKDSGFEKFNAWRLALKAIDARGLTTAQRERVGARANRQAFFSARVVNESLLAKMKKHIENSLNGERGFHREDFLKQMRKEMNLPEKDAPFTDVTKIESDQRLRLIYDTQTAMAQGEADYELFEDAELSEMFPCYELVRVEWRKETRDWREIWTSAGGTLYGGRMIAPREDPIWIAISDFGNPYPPFKYNSGMGVEPVSWAEAVDLGVIDSWYVAPPNKPLEDIA